MNGATKLLHAAEAAAAPSVYAPAEQTTQLLVLGQAWRNARLNQTDMITTDDAAQLVGTNRETINRWIGSGRCIGLARPVRGYRLPRWQFEPAVQTHLQAIAQALGTTEGWALLLFIETPHDALDGRTPRAALEQGEAARVIDLAAAEATAER
ncbi:MAG TPA: hypothetical protein PKC97_08635 [Burkholderiaceae bacterium]|nr:hypothetical protein [Burkholderiaceae bacterium]